jgi:hypothetical protein
MRPIQLRFDWSKGQPANVRFALRCLLQVDARMTASGPQTDVAAPLPRSPRRRGKGSKEAERLVSLLERQRSAPYNARPASSLSRTFDHSVSGGIGATSGDAGFRRVALIRRLVDATSTPPCRVRLMRVICMAALGSRSSRQPSAGPRRSLTRRCRCIGTGQVRQARLPRRSACWAGSSAARRPASRLPG